MLKFKDFYLLNENIQPINIDTIYEILPLYPKKKFFPFLVQCIKLILPIYHAEYPEDNTLTTAIKELEQGEEHLSSDTHRDILIASDYVHEYSPSTSNAYLVIHAILDLISGDITPIKIKDIIKRIIYLGISQEQIINLFNQYIGFKSEWLTSTVMGLIKERKRQWYTNSMLPIIADALQDADCNDEELLAHLRKH